MNPLLVRSCAFGTGHEKICVPLTAPDTPSLRQQAKAAIHAGCDLVEWRVDAMKDGLAIDVMRPALRALREEVGEKPILFTFRTKEEGALRPPRGRHTKRCTGPPWRNQTAPTYSMWN